MGLVGRGRVCLGWDSVQRAVDMSMLGVDFMQE